MKIGISLFLCCFVFANTLSGQGSDLKYYSVADLPLGGRGEMEGDDPFTRIDSVKAAALPERVQQLAGNTAGLYVEFESNAASLHLRWKLDEYRVLWNMTPLAVNGFDLYGWTGNQWQYMASAKPSGLENSGRLIGNLDGNRRQYRLYFPLYSGLRKLELGVPSSAEIRPPELPEPSSRILIYGSSITQGASASRPGMAFPSILGRALGVELLNFGFSGSAKMELEMAEMLGNIKTDLIILDCVPNPSAEEIRQRAVPFVKRLRELQPDTPILMVEGIFRENAHWDQKLHARVSAQNQAFREAWNLLLEAGYQNLHYLPNDQLFGEDHEATVDGVHLSDLGHFRIAEALGRRIGEVLPNTSREERNPASPSGNRQN